MQEIWKDIPNYEGLYQASNLGRIKGLRRYKQNHSKLQIVEEKIINQYVNKHNGYVYSMLYKDGTEKNCRVHKLIAQTFIPNPENKKTINHIDGNKMNNRVDNLEWATNKENIIHAIETGLASTDRNKIAILQYDKKRKLNSRI